MTSNTDERGSGRIKKSPRRSSYRFSPEFIQRREQFGIFKNRLIGLKWEIRKVRGEHTPPRWVVSRGGQKALIYHAGAQGWKCEPPISEVLELLKQAEGAGDGQQL